MSLLFVPFFFCYRLFSTFAIFLSLFWFFFCLCQEFEQKPSDVIVVEESYLIQRVRATLHGRIATENATPIIPTVMILSTPTRSFSDLAELHGGSDILSMFWVLGELDRLDSYSRSDSGRQLFPRKYGFWTQTDEDPHINKMIGLGKEIWSHYDFTELTDVIMKDREALLATCSPRYWR